MLDVIWQGLDNAARLALPFATALLCTFLSVAAWPLPYLGAIAPPLGLITLYYWAIHRPDLFGPGMAFALGLLNDILNSLPVGLSALLFVAAQQLVFRQRRFFTGHSFFMMWFGFIMMILLVTVSQWLGICLIRGQATPFFPILMQALLAILVFPLPCWILILLQRSALSQN